jgi:AraC-like DNA-binding protein
MSLTAWRRQLRLADALSRMADDESVTTIAHDLG